MSSPQRYCRKCLLREQENEAYASVKELIDQMDPDLKADPMLYEERLQQCRNCEKLISGMCRVCGCFVEVRAAVRKQSCPDPAHYW